MQRHQGGFTLIEMLVVISIATVIAATVYISPEAKDSPVLESQITTLKRGLEQLRMNAVYAGSPVKISAVGGSLQILQWQYKSANWVAASHTPLMPTFSEGSAIQIIATDTITARMNSSSRRASQNPVALHNLQQSLVFWPSGRSNGAQISFLSNRNSTQFVDITASGSIDLR